MVLKSIKYWWKNHKWVDTTKNYVLPRSYTVFWLNNTEERRALNFKKNNRGRFYQYCFTPGPIGICTHIRCRNEEGELCDEDITDYKTW